MSEQLSPEAIFIPTSSASIPKTNMEEAAQRRMRMATLVVGSLGLFFSFLVLIIAGDSHRRLTKIEDAIRGMSSP